MPEPIDLRSDTLTRPTESMRAAMARAEVGDDVFGEDPTINRLQELAAQRLGFEAGLYVPSGVMGNQVAQLVLGVRGTEVLVEADCHLVNYESGAGAMWAGVQYRTAPAPRGAVTAQWVRDHVRDGGYHDTPTSLVAIEQTHNRHGGTYVTEDVLRAVGEAVHDAELPLYVDGARVWNAIVADGHDPQVYGEVADALCFCVSKGLGAPVGSVLVGSAAFVEEARVWRRRLGGAMRQAGVLAAAGIHALEHHVDRLAEDHENARLLARTVAGSVPDAVEPAQVATNIVVIGTGSRSADDLVAELADHGVLVLAFEPDQLRVVTHLDVDGAACERAGQVIAELLVGEAA